MTSNDGPECDERNDCDFGSISIGLSYAIPDLPRLVVFK